MVHEYASLAGLVPLSRPPEFVGHDHYRITWEEIAEYPSSSHFYRAFAKNVYDEVCGRSEEFGLENRSGIKIGGWPTLVQRGYDLLLTDSYVMQIDMTENYTYGDAGVAYVYKQADGRWYVDFDCC